MLCANMNEYKKIRRKARIALLNNNSESNSVVIYNILLELKGGYFIKSSLNPNKILYKKLLRNIFSFHMIGDDYHGVAHISREFSDNIKK